MASRVFWPFWAVPKERSSIRTRARVREAAVVVVDPWAAAAKRRVLEGWWAAGASCRQAALVVLPMPSAQGERCPQTAPAVLPARSAAGGQQAVGPATVLPGPPVARAEVESPPERAGTSRPARAGRRVLRRPQMAQEAPAARAARPAILPSTFARAAASMTRPPIADRCARPAPRRQEEQPPAPEARATSPAGR